MWGMPFRGVSSNNNNNRPNNTICNTPGTCFSGPEVCVCGGGGVLCHRFFRKWQIRIRVTLEISRGFEGRTQKPTV